MGSSKVGGEGSGQHFPLIRHFLDQQIVHVSQVPSQDVPGEQDLMAYWKGGTKECLNTQIN